MTNGARGLADLISSHMYTSPFLCLSLSLSLSVSLSLCLSLSLSLSRARVPPDPIGCGGLLFGWSLVSALLSTWGAYASEAVNLPLAMATAVQHDYLGPLFSAGNRAHITVVSVV